MDRKKRNELIFGFMQINEEFTLSELSRHITTNEPRSAPSPKQLAQHIKTFPVERIVQYSSDKPLVKYKVVKRL